MKKYFITDLDRTIIHSQNPNYTCVEKLKDREITYMTDYSIEKMNELLLKEDFVFVPCSMRNYSQTMRVDFISKYSPKYMICDNGAQIYVDGVLDKEWDNYMNSLIDKESVVCGIEKIKELPYKFRDIKNIDGFYIAISFYEEEEANKSYKDIEKLFEDPYKTMKIGRKIFVIHEKIDKSSAVKYFIDKYKVENYILSGDTEVDRRFTSMGKSILPKHASFRHDNSVVTTKPGILSTDEILDYVENEFFRI